MSPSRPQPQRGGVSATTRQPVSQSSRNTPVAVVQSKPGVPPVQNKTNTPPQQQQQSRQAPAPRAVPVPAARPQSTLNVQSATLPSTGTGCIIVQLVHPRILADIKYVVHCHIKAPDERWRESNDKSFTRDIVNERKEDKAISFTRLQLVYGHAQILTGLQPGQYSFRIQSWPYGLLSELKEFTVIVKSNEATILSTWIHSYTPVGAMNSSIYTDIIKIKAGANLSAPELLARSKAIQIKLDKSNKSFHMGRTLAGCFRTALLC